MFDFTKKKKMPILADISRRLQLLTTDAKPDPPRNDSNEYTNNLPPPANESRQKSYPIPPNVSGTSEAGQNSVHRGKSIRGTSPEDSGSSGLENEDSPDTSKKSSKNTKTPRSKSKIPWKTAQAVNIVNYNIINSNRVNIGATKTYVCNINQCTKSSGDPCDDNSTKRKTRTMPKNIEDLTTSKLEITIEDIFVVKTHIGHAWRDVVRRLGYSEGQMDQFEENHRSKGIDEIIYQVFLDWKQANTKDAQLGTLTSILWSCQEYDCAEKLAAAQKTPT